MITTCKCFFDIHSARDEATGKTKPKIFQCPIGLLISQVHCLSSRHSVNDSGCFGALTENQEISGMLRSLPISLSLNGRDDASVNNSGNIAVSPIDELG